MKTKPNLHHAVCALCVFFADSQWWIALNHLAPPTGLVSFEDISRVFKNTVSGSEFYGNSTSWMESELRAVVREYEEALKFSNDHTLVLAKHIQKIEGAFGTLSWPLLENKKPSVSEFEKMVRIETCKRILASQCDISSFTDIRECGMSTDMGTFKTYSFLSLSADVYKYHLNRVPLQRWLSSSEHSLSDHPHVRPSLQKLSNMMAEDIRTHGEMVGTVTDYLKQKTVKGV